MGNQNLIDNEKMKLIALSILAAVAVSGSMYMMMKSSDEPVMPTPAYDSWVHWMNKNNRAYGTTAERKFRQQIWYMNY